MTPAEEREAEANRNRLVEATAATLLLLKRRRRRIVSAGLRRGTRVDLVAEELRHSLRAGILEAREVARAHGLGSLERELAAKGRALGVSRSESSQVVRDVYRAVSGSTSYANQWRRAAVTAAETASAQTDHALERTATTEAVDAFNAARSAAFEALGVPELGRRWDATLDARVCDFCFGLDGTIVPVGESFPNGEPPVHPNCRCTWSIVEMNTGAFVSRPRFPSEQRPYLQ